MRTVLLLGLVVGGAFMAGWFTIEREGDRTRIEINKSEIRNDARQAIDKGRDILDRREQERLAREQQLGSPDGQQGWPPAAAPMPGNGVPSGYEGQTSYGTQPYYGQQPNDRQQPHYGAPTGYQNQQPQQQRWSEMPPPWQQQTR